MPKEVQEKLLHLKSLSVKARSVGSKHFKQAGWQPGRRNAQQSFRRNPLLGKKTNKQTGRKDPVLREQQFADIFKYIWTMISQERQCQRSPLRDSSNILIKSIPNY